MPRPGRVLITGGFGYDDIGDEAMPMAVVRNLRERLPDLEIIMLSPNVANTEAVHRERSISDLSGYMYGWSSPVGTLIQRVLSKALPSTRISSARSALRFSSFLACTVLARAGMKVPMQRDALAVLGAIRGADVLFNVGGGNINSVIRTELYQKSLLHLAARLSGVPSILSGQTIGPFERYWHKLLVRFCLGGVDTVTLRDAGESRARLAEAGVHKPVMIDTADDAITLAPTRSDRVGAYVDWARVTGAGSGLRPYIAALNANGYVAAMGEELDAAVGLLADVADRLVVEAGAVVLLVPTDYGSSSDDRPLLRRVQKSMAHDAAALVVEESLDPSELRSLVGAADLALGSRYHFAVFAAAEGVPFVAFANTEYQRTKLRGLAALYGLPLCYLDQTVSDMTADDLRDRLRVVMGAAADIRQTLHDMTPVLAKRSLVTIERAAALMRGQ